MNAVLDKDLFDVDSIEEEEAKEVETTMPAYGSQEWNDYVMEKFDRKDLIDGNPTCAGLRRVAEDVLGDIVSSRPSQVFPSTDENGPGRATVVFEVVINWMNSGELRTYADVADVWHGNTDDLFCAHPVATASTRAEGRALRKALKIRCLAAEELTRKKDVESIVRETVSAGKTTDGQWDEEDNISAAQIRFLDTKCKQLNIDVVKFINMGSENYKSVEDIKKKIASKMLSMLNEFQTKNKETPKDIKGYDSNWR